MITIDINCDLGEGGLYDHKLMPLITSCSIACGGHFGNIDTMSSTVVLAKQHQVKIGAHPSYPDHQNFGRVSFKDMPIQDLKDSLLNQLQTLNDIANFHNYPLTHIKPHGALYNAASKYRDIAKCVAEAIKELGLNVLVYGQADSEFELVSRKNDLNFCAEVFADRTYEDDLRLRARNLEGSVLHQKEDVLTQIFEMVVEEKVTAYSGKRLPIKAETICLHSDTKGSKELARNIHQFLKNHGVRITSP